jgi:hypothetical protein
MTALERELESALLDLWRKWKLVGYHNNYFKEMVTKTKNAKVYKGPTQTVLHLLTGAPGNGFEVLLKAGKRDWTVEALLKDPKWKPLFADWVFQNAENRLRRSGSN